MFESYTQSQRGLINRLQDTFTIGSELIQLGVGSLPAPPPTPPSSLPVGTKLQVPRSERVTTVGGSVVASPSLDRLYHQYAQSQEVQDRLLLDLEIEQTFASEILTKAACDKLARGAVAKGFSLDISPAVDSAEAEYHAKLAEFVLSPIHKNEFTGNKLGDIAFPLLKFANLPIQIVSDEAGNINYLQPHAPFGFKINNDSQFKFKPKQKDAYIQYDISTWQPVVKGIFTESQIVWAALDRQPWERYGNPAIVPALHHARGLIRGFGMLPDARDASMPEKVFPAHDINGNPLDEAAIKDLEYQLPASRIARGEKPSPFQATILNGGQNPTVLTVGTDYFNQLGDLRKHQELVCVAFGICIAILVGQESVNRATMESLLEALYEGQAIYAGYIEDQIIREVFKRALIWAGVKPNLVQIKIVWSQRKSPDRARSEAIDAMTFTKAGLITPKSASQIVCGYLGLNHKAEQLELDKQQITQTPTNQADKPEAFGPGY
jgi:hypothetical protein